MLEFVAQRMADDMRDMLALLVERMGVVGGEARLRCAHDEAIGETVHMHAVQRARTFSPFLGKAQPVAAIDLIARTLRVARANFKARRIDEAVEFIFNAVNHHTFFGDALDAATLRVDEMDIGTVEGREIFVVEAGALAELIVIGLQRLSGGLVFDNGFNALADLFHLLEIGKLHKLRRVLLRLGCFLCGACMG